MRWSTCDFWRQLRRFAALCLPCTTKLLAITRTHIALMDSSFGVGAQKPLRRVVCDWERLSRCGLAILVASKWTASSERSAKAAARQSLPPTCIQPNGKRRSQSCVWGRPCVRAVSKAKHQDYRVLSIDSCAMTCAAFVVADGGRCTVHFLHLHFLFTDIG